MKISIEITGTSLTNVANKLKAKAPSTLKTKASQLNTTTRSKIKAWANTL